MKSNLITATMLIISAVLTRQQAQGQDVPWVAFQDTQSASLCDVINAANIELVLLGTTSELVAVSGADTIIDGTFVNENNQVFFNNQPVGTLAFDTDADGFRTLWWVSLTGRVIAVDGFDGTPTESDAFPSDFENVPCDACEFWDDQSVCQIDVTDPDINLDLCGLISGSTLALTMLGLTGLKMRRRFGINP
ncbi:MAG: hypothetical protein ACPGXK_12275 [Phycisphaerae bacterium]